MEIPQKTKYRTTIWPSNFTFGYLSEEKTLVQKIYIHPCVYCSIIYNSQAMEAAQVSINRWVDKMTMGHLSKGVLLNCKKEGNFSMTEWINLENIMLSEISQSEKGKCHMILFICVMWWTNWTNKQNGDRIIEFWLTALQKGLGGGEIEQNGKWTHGYGQQCSDWGGLGHKEDKW